jgi:hypothetical protein
MIFENTHIGDILKSLVPKDQAELSVLRVVLQCAQWLTNKGAAVTQLSQPIAAFVEGGAEVVMPDEIRQLLAVIPEESKKYFHGLVEAMEIYQAIYGQALSVQSIGLTDKSVYEIKQIRDMCLEEGLHSIY